MSDEMRLRFMLDTLGPLAVQAGLEIMSVRARGFEVEEKADHSPVTAADLASHKVIAAGLESAYPDIPVLSEEGAGVEYDERKQWDNFFLVDPLDGTKEFVKDNGEFCVCIAYMEDVYPVLGVVYAPVQSILYMGGRDVGAFRSVGGGMPEVLCVAGDTGDAGLAVAGSRSHPDPRMAEFLGKFNVRETITAGSALKMCMVAEGRADLYPRFNPTMEWDTAAGQAIVEGAGGVFNDWEGRRFQYNKKSLKNPGFCCGSQFGVRTAGCSPAS